MSMACVISGSASSKLLLSFLLVMYTQDVRDERHYFWKENGELKLYHPKKERVAACCNWPNLQWVIQENGASRSVIRKEQGSHCPLSSGRSTLLTITATSVPSKVGRRTGTTNKTWLSNDTWHLFLGPVLFSKKAEVLRTGRSSDLPLKKAPPDHFSHW